MLYIIRGVSGSGKSTFAKTLANSLKVDYYEADMYHYKDGVYDWKFENIAASHAWCQNMVIEALGKGLDVVVSNTFTTEKELSPYFAIAKELNSDVTCLIVENRHEGINIHNVPYTTLVRQEQRLKGSIKLK